MTFKLPVEPALCFILLLAPAGPQDSRYVWYHGSCDDDGNGASMLIPALLLPNSNCSTSEKRIRRLSIVLLLFYCAYLLSLLAVFDFEPSLGGIA